MILDQVLNLKLQGTLYLLPNSFYIGNLNIGKMQYTVLYIKMILWTISVSCALW